jgi:hypothetical protein
MNDNEALLTELRKISAWADLQRKVMKWTLLVMAIAIPAVIVIGVLMEHRAEKTVEQIAAPSEQD